MQTSAIHATATAFQPAVSWADMATHRAYLVGFARRRLLDPALAEDLVHDVFEAVASGAAAFGGRSALRSWLVAILKHKIVDLVRQRVGHDSLETGHGGGVDDGGDDDEGLQLVCPQPRPDEIAEQRQRLRRTLTRIAALPESLRGAVERRLLQDDSTEDVCRALAISEQNLFVRLHRARRALAA
jgi:RNA polymerase sigma-70 factor (ECF subfamily)